MIEKPESPHDLVPFWPDIDETQLASVGAQYGKLSAAATQALNKSRGDSKELNDALVEGFDTQVGGVLLVGGQHSKVAEFDSQSAGVIADAAVAFTEAKTQIVATTHAYEAMISVREFEIQLLTASPMFGALGGEYKRARIDQLKREIEQLIKAARKMNDARYEGIMPPAEPANPSLTVLKTTHRPGRQTISTPRRSITVPETPCSTTPHVPERPLRKKTLEANIRQLRIPPMMN